MRWGLLPAIVLAACGHGSKTGQGGQDAGPTCTVLTVAGGGKTTTYSCTPEPAVTWNASSNVTTVADSDANAGGQVSFSISLPGEPHGATYSSGDVGAGGEAEYKLDLNF